jgi:glyoxalase-like protein
MTLDHIVIAFNDLSKAIDDWRAQGFTVEPGGRHPGRTSHNALVVFEDGAYVELIAWAQPGPKERWYNVLTQHGEGLMDFALIPESVPAAIEAAKSRGLDLNGPIDGGRVRPDGRQLKWQTARQSTFDLPFLCGDVTPREWRVPQGTARKHANGKAGIAKVTVAVDDVNASLSRYEALLGSLDLTGGSGIRLGATVIELVRKPRSRGEGPDAIELR